MPAPQVFVTVARVALIIGANLASEGRQWQREGREMDFRDSFGVEARLKRLRSQLAEQESLLRETPLQRSLHRQQLASEGGEQWGTRWGVGHELFPGAGWTWSDEETRRMGSFDKRIDNDLQRRRLERQRELELQRRREEERARSAARRHWERAHRLLLEAEGEARMAEEAWRRASPRRTLW